MRNAIILPDKLESLFIYEAEKSGLIKPIYNLADELFSGCVLADADKFYKHLLDNKIIDKQNLFRTLLLFDDIILSTATENYEYDKLTETGFFSIFYLEDALSSDPIHKDGHIEYATYLKPAILPVFENVVKSYFRYGEAKGGFTNFISDLYDTILLDKRLPKKHNDFIEFNKTLFDIRNKKNIKRLETEFKNIPKILTSERFFTDVSGLLCTLYESLCWQLEISSNKDAAIIDCDFQLANIGCEEYTNDVSNSMEAYNILRIECGKIIGSLPQMNSIQEVLRIKEQRKNDIHNLKQELSRLEYEIRSGNSIKAAEKAAKDIEKASKALSKGNIARSVTKWTNMFSIPVGIASLYMEQPEITIGSGVITLIGKTSSVIEAAVKDRNKWFEIIF